VESTGEEASRNVVEEPFQPPFEVPDNIHSRGD
jgi:hypothetical protein